MPGLKLFHVSKGAPGDAKGNDRHGIDLVFMVSLQSHERHAVS